MKSVWQESCNFEEKMPLQNDCKTDVLIIGGGMTGILCARFLNEQGVNCIVVEAGRIGQRATGKTTGKITSQHGLIYNKLLQRWGAEYAKLYLQAQETAIQMYARLSEDVDCHFERRSNLVYSLDGKRNLEKEMKALETLGFAARYREDTNLPFRTDGAIEFPLQAQFHPLKFLRGISKGLTIYENTRITRIKKQMAVTAEGKKIFADRIIVASHFPFWNRHGGYFVKMYQERACMLAGDEGWQLEGMYIDGSGGGLSLRNYGLLTIVAGSSRRTGNSVCGWSRLEEFCRDFFPNWQERYRWANQDCMTLDEVPYVGPYFSGQEWILTAAGYNKWGMSGSMAAAMILTDRVLGRDNPFAKIFSPDRSIWTWQLARNGIETCKNMIKPTAPRCSHLGCALKWNEEEVSWDCPCHGSRFDEEGRWLESPAKKDIKL